MDAREPESGAVYGFGPFRLDADERQLTRDGEAVPLEPKTFKLLVTLVAADDRLKSRAELIAELWPNTIVEEQGLTLRIHALRQALGDTGKTPRYIETVRGGGYRFIAPITVEDEHVPSGVDRSQRPWLVPAAAGFAVVLMAAGFLLWWFGARAVAPAAAP